MFCVSETEAATIREAFPQERRVSAEVEFSTPVPVHHLGDEGPKTGAGGR